MRSDSTVSSQSSNSGDSRQRKDVDELHQIGYTLDELKVKRNEPKWRVTRYTAIVLFWAIWGALLAGSIVIVVLNDNDVSPTTSAPITTTTKGK